MQYGMQYGRDLDLDLARRQSSMRHTADPLFLSRSVEYRNSILYGTEYTYPYGTVLPYGSRAVLIDGWGGGVRGSLVPYWNSVYFS